MAKRNASPPDFIDPSKPKRHERPPSGDRWLHEIKFDGYRVGIRLDRGQVSVLSSGGSDYTKKAGPEIASAIAALDAASAYLDGELVVEAPNGVSDFGALQNDLGSRRTDRLRVYLFDLMFLDGKDLKSLPLHERKSILGRLLGDLPRSSPLRFSQHYEEVDGETMHARACQLGVEGVVSKLRDSRYIPGDRGGAVWRKAICRQESTYVICGYVPSSSGAVETYFGEREGLNILYRGHVSIPERHAAAIKSALAGKMQPRNPFADKPTPILKKRGVRFVKPVRKIAVGYRGTTESGKLRHAYFLGLPK